MVCINYNQWFQEKDYRRKLASQLGVSFSDAGLTTVPNVGGGSSFDGIQMNGQARSMDVTMRWQQYVKDPAFRALFERESVWQYSQQIFGDLPGTQRLRPYAPAIRTSTVPCTTGQY